MTEPAPEVFVAGLLPKLRSERLCYFPIRHHSPACAAHVRRWIETHRPASVLVEGPASFTGQIPFLVDERCLCPVALYTTFIDKHGRLTGKGSSEERAADTLFGPPRFAAYYPFCDYSPELVALRHGQAMGARLRFIDLEYAEMILTRLAETDAERPPVRVESLAAEPHLRHSEYLRALARRLGCRDFNELWDHLFEATADTLETEAFMDRLAAYCAMARLDYTPEMLSRDATTAREACMAAAIREELARNEAERRGGPVLVVTGGFHTVALPDLVTAETMRPKPPELAEDEAGAWLMRYSFDQLDALAGYASGMPSPAYYDRLWHAAGGAVTGLAAHGQRVAGEVIVDIGRLSRARALPSLVSTADAIGALQMARQLALLRQHPWPLREDMLDGIRACFIKGEVGVEGQVVLRLVHEVLAGNRVGDLPPGTAVPPIVSDFLREARRLRLPVEAVERRELALDLYRNARHREMSRFFHRLDLLSAPFAQFLSGPDFVQGTGLDLMQEHWQDCWSPATESALIEAAAFGPTVEEAAGNRLRQLIAALEDAGQGRNTQAAVTLLVRACRLGLHAQAASLVPLIDVHIAGDPALPSLAAGLSQLEMLLHSREPLEATQLTAVPALMTAAYERSCRLLDDLAACPDDAVELNMNALRLVREVLTGSGASAAGPADNRPTLDGELFHQGLRRILTQPPAKAQAAIVGAAAGILYGDGQLSEEALVRVVCGYLGAALTEPRKTSGILRGLLATAREAAWQVAELVRAIDGQFAAWDEKTFLEVLPELRLAFTSLTPREIAQVSDHVASLHGQQSLGELVHVDLDEAEVQFALAVTQRVRESLRAEHLVSGGNP